MAAWPSKSFHGNILRSVKGLKECVRFAHLLPLYTDMTYVVVISVYFSQKYHEREGRSG